MIRMNRYSVKLKHDKGTIKIGVTARNKETAEMMVCNAERAPRRAIIETNRA